jgi:serine/threonine-protein kinase PknG
MTRIGGGLVHVPPISMPDPSSIVLADPSVAEDRRFCSACDGPVGRSRNGAAGRANGFCPVCGHPFAFTPKLKPGELVGGQYEIVGCLAHGGLGWIYLAKDRKVSDRWVVLKGLLNTSDASALAAALAERRFLAEVEHPNIVKIHNFTEHDDDGYIVMEYVAGVSLRRLLENRRAANGGHSDPLPPSLAIAYMLDVLPAIEHLHAMGLLYCDLKPDNVIQTATSMKLIDLGGVYRMQDSTSPIYGTVGYQAPEIADTGPTIASDVFTVGRTLAALCIDFRGYQGQFRFDFPDQQDVELFSRFDSLYRFLLRATARRPEDRFSSCDDAAEQLTGVLREIVAAEEGRPVPGSSHVFNIELSSAIEGPDARALPSLLVRADDPAAAFLASLPVGDVDEQLAALDAAPEHTVEIDLRAASILLDARRFDAAEALLAGIPDDGDWRTDWLRGRACLAQDHARIAEAHFGRVYEAVPGELAPKVALGFSAEQRKDAAASSRWYDIVSRTDPAFPSAAFGLARTRAALGDRAGAGGALDRVPTTSSTYVEAQLAKARLMVHADDGSAPDVDAINVAAAIAERLPLDDKRRAALYVDVLQAALVCLQAGVTTPGQPPIVLGRPLTERDVRLGLEAALRSLARHTTTAGERIALVDRANRVRPRTLT